MKINKKFLVVSVGIIAVIFLVSLLSGCQSRVSDSGLDLKSVGKNIDNNIYVLNVTMLGTMVSSRNITAQGTGRQYSDIYGYENLRLWQDGKGMVEVRINSITPSLSYIKPESTIVLKTTDLKIMAISPGYSFEVKCRNDYEPVAALQNNEMISSRHDTYELDYCRMTNPEIKWVGEAELEPTKTAP